MKAAQELYEGVEAGELGTVGLITYMRTDSLRISEEARAAGNEFITETSAKSIFLKSRDILNQRVIFKTVTRLSDRQCQRLHLSRLSHILQATNIKFINLFGKDLLHLLWILYAGNYENRD